jgi:predicted HicB family RNase H-like nuclease
MHGKSDSVNHGLQITNSGADLEAAIAEGATEPLRMITLRIPKSLHEQLKADAHSAHKSMNQLCIDRLLRLPELTTEEA